MDRSTHPWRSGPGPLESDAFQLNRQTASQALESVLPISFKVLPAVRTIHVRCEGIVSLDEILCYEVDVVADPRFDSAYAEVFDLREAEKLDVSQGDVTQIVGYEKSHEQYVGSRKAAFIAPQDLEYGLGRMYELMEDDSPMETRVFRDASAACEWLGLPLAELDGP